MNEKMKDGLVAITVALSVSAIGAVFSLYTDVQMLKKDQEQQTKYNAEQVQMRELLINLDKNFAVQAEAFRALTITIEELKREKQNVSRN